MSTTVNQPPTPRASFFARSRKAFVAGGVAALTAAGSGIATAFADGKFTSADGWILLGLALGGFAVGFAATWQVPNAPAN